MVRICNLRVATIAGSVTRIPSVSTFFSNFSDVKLSMIDGLGSENVMSDFRSNSNSEAPEPQKNMPTPDPAKPPTRRKARKVMHMGGCQNYGPFLGTLNIKCRTIFGTQKGTLILLTTHMDEQSFVPWCRRDAESQRDPGAAPGAAAQQPQV